METTLHPNILAKLAALRRSLRLRLAAEGVAAVVLSLVALVFLTLGLDYWLALERPARVAVLALGAAGVGVVAWRRLAVPLAAGMSVADLALLVEDRYAHLGDRLISAIQFSAAGAAGDSPALVRRLVDQANDMAEPLDLAPIVERRSARRLAAAGACALALLAGFALWQSELMACWLSRNLGLTNTPWPQDIYLSVSVPGQEGPDFVAVRGEDLKLLVTARRKSPAVPWPAEVTLHVEGWDSEKIELTNPNAGTYARTMRGVNEEFTFHVTCDADHLDRRRPHHVRLIDPPALKDVQFVIAYPAHMVRTEPGETLTGPRSGISVPVGADVTVRAAATKEIKAARMVLDANGRSDVRPMRYEDPAPDKPAGPRMLVGDFSLPAGAKNHYHSLRILLEDTDGAANSHAANYRIDPRPDAPPEIHLSSFDVSRKVTARATIPLGLTVKDDNGLTGVWIDLSRKGDFSAPATWPLLSRPDQPRQFANPDMTRAGDANYQPFKLDLEPLAIKADEQPDIYVRARAADNLPADRFGGPNRAVSDKVLVFTVAPDDVVMDILLQRQRGLRVDLVAAREEQVKALARTQAAEKVFADPAKVAAQMEPEGRADPVWRTEQTVAATSSRVADAMGEVLVEMKNNRLGNAKASDLIAREFMDPLRAAAREAVAAEADCQALAKDAEAPRRKARLGALVGGQQKIIARLDRVLDTMEQAASLQEAINRATLIRKAWDEIQEKTRRILDEELRGIVQPATSQPAPEAP